MSECHNYAVAIVIGVALAILMLSRLIRYHRIVTKIRYCRGFKHWWCFDCKYFYFGDFRYKRCTKFHFDVDGGGTCDYFKKEV